MKSKTISVGVVILSSFVLVIAKDLSTSEADLRVDSVVRPVPIAIVEKTPSNKTRCFPAKVRANRRVELAFSVSGQLEKLNGEEGRSLKQGELIAQLDQRDYLYRFNIAQAKLENAEKELDRCKNLWDQKVISDTDYDNSTLAYKVSLAEFQIKKKALEDTTIYAPFDGIIVKRFVENQEHVQEQKTIVLFQDISKIEVVVQIPEQMLACGIHTLKNPQVSFDKDGVSWFDATIKEYCALSNNATHTYDVVFCLSIPESMHVYPGMIAQVRTELELPQKPPLSSENNVRIPINALVHDEDGTSYVWRIDPLNLISQKKKVHVHQFFDDYVDVYSELRPGDRVAVAGLKSLSENSSVRPMVDGKEGLEG